LVARREQARAFANIEHSVKWSVKLKVMVGVATICVLGLVAYTSLRDYSFRQREFDPRAWKQGNLRARGEMVDSLQARSLLRDKTREEVLDLLGTPDESHEGQLRYRVDMGRRIGWRPFPVSLLVEFDDKSRVYRVERLD
jgi:hypothetical protein